MNEQTILDAIENLKSKFDGTPFTDEVSPVQFMFSYDAYWQTFRITTNTGFQLYTITHFDIGVIVDDINCISPIQVIRAYLNRAIYVQDMRLLKAQTVILFGTAVHGFDNNVGKYFVMDEPNVRLLAYAQTKEEIISQVLESLYPKLNESKS